MYALQCLFYLVERQKLFDEVDKEWTEREKQATLSASPSGSDVPEEECEGDTSDESEECIVKVQIYFDCTVGLQAC